MTVRSIFLFAPAETAVADKGPAAYAIGLAKAYDAHLTIFTIALDVTTPGRVTDTAGVAAGLCSAAQAAAVKYALVSEHSHAMGVHEVIAEHARLHDLTIIGVDKEGILSERMIAEHLMFDSGRPLIIVPKDYRTPHSTGPIAVAWDNTAAAARALGDALAFLRPEEVHLLTIEGDKQLPTDLESDALVAVIGWRGVKAEHSMAAIAGRSIATALQEEAQAAGCAMLVMGAYGHSRLRRFFLGSATADILTNNRMPTILSH